MQFKDSTETSNTLAITDVTWFVCSIIPVTANQMESTFFLSKPPEHPYFLRSSDTIVRNCFRVTFRKPLIRVRSFRDCLFPSARNRSSEK